MKRLLMVLLAALLLAGCGKNPPPMETVASTQATDNATEHLYDADSAVERDTGGAVRTYLLKPDTYFGIRKMGSHVLLMGHKGLTVLTGDLGGVTASQITGEVRINSVLDTAATGLAYYMPTSRQVVIRNPMLQTVTTWELPKEIVGDPCISFAANEVFYSTGTEIRARNMTTGISRLLRRQTAGTQTLLGAYFDGKALLCTFTDETGLEETVFISTETGQDLGQGKGVSGMQTFSDRYYACWQDGIIQQTVFGSKSLGAKSLQAPVPDEKTGGRAAILEKNGIVEYSANDRGLTLTFYDMTSGKKTAQATLPQVHSPIGFCSDGRYIWLLATDAGKVCQCVYRWDITQSVIADENVYTSVLFTPDSPDAEGLARCKALAEAYQSNYGIKFLFWQDAVAHTGGYTVTEEYHAQVIEDVLIQAEPLLKLFPSRFLVKSVEGGWIKVALVQSIDGDRDWVQFWEEGDCWILLSSGADVTQSLIQGIAYAIDSHVLGNSREYDTWSELNPKDFVYSYNEELKEDSLYLFGKERAFTDAYAMCYPHEDRCHIFFHAMKEDNADMFQSSAMQAKLLRLCTGIREAYNLEKKTDTYTWEQYLNEPIAYVPEPKK